MMCVKLDDRPSILVNISHIGNHEAVACFDRQRPVLPWEIEGQRSAVIQLCNLIMVAYSIRVVYDML